MRITQTRIWRAVAGPIAVLGLAAGIIGLGGAASAFAGNPPPPQGGSQTGTLVVTSTLTFTVNPGAFDFPGVNGTNPIHTGDGTPIWLTVVTNDASGYSVVANATDFAGPANGNLLADALAVQTTVSPQPILTAQNLQTSMANFSGPLQTFPEGQANITLASRNTTSIVGGDGWPLNYVLTPPSPNLPAGNYTTTIAFIAAGQ